MTGKRKVRDWQKTDPHIRHHPTFLKFRARLGVTPILAHGILSGLFAFAFDFAHDGDLSRFTPEDIAIGIEYDGDPQELWDALDGGFVIAGIIHDWHEWGGAVFEQRAREASKKASQRYGQDGVLSPEQGEMSRGHNGTMGDNAPDKIREELKVKSIRPDSPAAPPKKVIWDNFLVWWAAYGKVGSRADAALLYNHWIQQGASADDLLIAAKHYHAACLAKDSFQAHGRTFLAKKPNRWKEWVTPEVKTDGNGHGPAPEGKRWCESYDISKPAGERYVWVLVDA